MLADVSLWSANLANLAAGIAVVEQEADSFHFDVADAHFAPALLFFPDLLRAVRPLTPVPFHVHLMAERPSTLIADFIGAGADWITVHVESEGAHDALEQIRASGRRCGIALKLETPIATAMPFLTRVESVLLLGTSIGVKGQDLDPRACDRIRRLRSNAPPAVRIIADGAIRRNTVPMLREAGADAVVPGSLVFADPDPAGVLRWLRSVT